MNDWLVFIFDLLCNLLGDELLVIDFKLICLIIFGSDVNRYINGYITASTKRYVITEVKNGFIISDAISGGTIFIIAL